MLKILYSLTSRAACCVCRTNLPSLNTSRSYTNPTLSRPIIFDAVRNLLRARKGLAPSFQTTVRRNANSDAKRAPLKLRNASWNDLKNIFTLAVPYKGRILLGLSFLGISSTIFMLTPRILGKLIDANNQTTNEPSTSNEKKEDLSLRIAQFFMEYPVALVGVLLLGAVAIVARAYCMHTAGQLVINDLRRKVFKSVLLQDMAFFDRNKVGEIVSRLSTDAFIVGYSVSMNLSDGARALVTCLGSAGLMTYTSPTLCKVVVFVIPIIVGAFAVFGRLQRKYTLMMQEAIAGSNQVATERFSNVRTVRMLVSEDKEVKTYDERINEIWKISRKEGLAKGLMFGGFQFTGYMALTVVLFYGSNLISQGLLTYGDLSSFCIYAILCGASLSSLSGFYVEVMKGLGASSRLFELKNRIPAIPITGGKRIEDIRHEIKFESVAFGYSDRIPIFHDVSFRIPVGKVTAVVGPSGTGKSTIAYLLLRLYDVSAGRITVDDADLRELDPSHWRRMIGTVGQVQHDLYWVNGNIKEPVLFSASIWDNIVYGLQDSEEVTEARVRRAARQANALDFIEHFPNGFHTMVGESGGSMMSGGQKQRIAIARALVTQPRILIMDEATSALDATSEYMVRTALSKLLQNSHQTVLIIAHRLSTIKHADQIVVLDRGTIVEHGTFDQLIRIKNGIFRQLVDKQTIGWSDDVD